MIAFFGAEIKFIFISGSSNHGAQANKENGIGGPPDVNNLRLAGSGSGSESASDHNGHLLVNGNNSQGNSGHGYGSDHGMSFGQQLNRPPFSTGLRAVPPPVVTTSTILSHDGIG